MDRQESIKLLKEVLEIQTVNQKDDEGKLAEFIQRYLEAAGVSSQVIRIDETHADVIAELRGESEETVIWNGHLDTVPYGEEKEWNTDPRIPSEKAGKIYARGASDMKSGLAAMVYTLAFMKREGIVPKKTIYFAGTCDEERLGLGARHLIIHKMLPKASLLLIGEPTGLRLGVAQKGCVWLKLLVSGVTSHGAYPKEGTNAIEYGMYACQVLKEQIEDREHQILGNATVQVTKVKGGIAPNMTPDRAEFTLDIRILPGMNSLEISEILERICGQLRKESGSKAEFQFQILNDRKAIEIAEDHPWVQKFRDTLSETRETPEDIGINYFTDASILAQADERLPVLILGPGEPAMAHKPNEFVEIQKYLDFIELLKDVFGRNV